MQDVNVVVVFYSRTGRTEQLALAAAVGAVQGRANIRLRRLPDMADEAAITSVPEWKENRDRMNMEYVAPRGADVAWADAIVAGVPAEGDGPSPDFAAWAGKIGAAFHDGPHADALCEAMRRAGIVVVEGAHDADPIAAACMRGRRVAEAARARKASA